MQSWSVVEKVSLNCLLILDFYFREWYMDRASRRAVEWEED